MVTGKEAFRPGEAKKSWLSGTAAWNFVVISQYILGIRPQYDGLLIDPCIPAEWESFRVRRILRNQTFDIEVHNPQHVNKGVMKMELDGQIMEGNLLPFDDLSGKPKVLILMGK